MAEIADRRAPPAHEDPDTAEHERPLRFFALKDADTFIVADAVGDIHGVDDGMFRDDTRVLSRWRLRIGSDAPALLASDVSRDNLYFTAHLTNRPLPELGDQAAPRGVVHIERTRFVWCERMYERIELDNFGGRKVRVPLVLHFAADFADIFEVRGTVRDKRGQYLAPEVRNDRVVLRYRGLDGATRACAIAFHPAPARITATRAQFDVTLADREATALLIEVGPDIETTPSESRFREAAAQARRRMRRLRRRGASVKCSGELFGVWLDKSRADLALLTTDLPTGPYPYAGIPWFATTFGRDGIVTALELLWLDPSLARGVLGFLAATQAHATSAFADAAPGKVIHETRKGEMAALGEVPFARYYGGVDGTPLFVMLAGAYANRTADLATIDELWPSLVDAMKWVDGAGDSNRDGLLDYARAAESGLANQGWKDSVDSVFHADGRMAVGPIALVEVQGYVYAARLAMANLASRRGEHDAAQRYAAAADSLRAAVESRYWMEDESLYGIAIDGTGTLCRVAASNAGHLLFAGLPAAGRAQRVMQRMLEGAFDSGWGLRTLARTAPNFNPMSYHNGSVWPHDTAICASGFARYGNKEGAVHWLDEIFRTASHFGMRMPELYCGFPRRPGEPPIAYPVACLPQAWSAGCVFMLLQACLGLTIDAWHGEILIDRPALPREIDWLEVNGLAVGASSVDLVFQRTNGRVVAAASSRVPDDVRVTIRL
jgi:glycogen debranching enzyme